MDDYAGGVRVATPTICSLPRLASPQNAPQYDVHVFQLSCAWASSGIRGVSWATQLINVG
eukprot:2620613-Heterocapsa_arctica.AAC.1